MFSPILTVLLLFSGLALLLIILHLGKGAGKSRSSKKASSKKSKKSGRGSGGGGIGGGKDDSEDVRGCCALCLALCGIFCCPPCPCCIVNKLAFHPPSSASYSISSGGGKSSSNKGKGGGGGSFKPGPAARWPFSSQDLGTISAFSVKTASGQRVACMYVPGESRAKYTLLFSHGNASDLGQMASLYFLFTRLLPVNIFSYDYEGYGLSGGRPSESALYEDVDAAYKALVERMAVPPKRIVLYGQSIGSVPTIDLASRTKHIAGVIVQSGLASACQVLCPTSCCHALSCNAFANEAKIAEVSAPVLIVHGTADEVISVEHGIALYKAAPKTVDPCWVHGAHHNDVVLYPEVHRRLEKFLHQVEQVQEKLLEL